MSGIGESHCPICRSPYKYFPAICYLLHNILRKLKPEDYKRREDEVLESEKEIDCFSPGFNRVATCETSSSEEATSDSGQGPDPNLDESLPKSSGSIPGEISIADALCARCEQLLFRPAVLNCGHAYCEYCAASLVKEREKCRVCGALHPGEPPQVCLPLSAILELIFPKEYDARKASVQSEPPPSISEPEQPIISASENASEVDNVHYLVGCDYCGMYPIVGKRYKCLDCKDKMGFDLCEGCYLGRCNFEARFNQQHTPDHNFIVYDSPDFGRAWHSMHTIGVISIDQPDSPESS